MRILAIDDEELQLETIAEYIAEAYPHADFVGFSKVSQVLNYTEIGSVDVAILDISLPGSINGIHLGELLRKKNRRIKLLYCTGYSDYAIDAFKMHANGYLQKPVLQDDFLREMQYILQMPVFDAEEKPYIQAFGNFDVFVKGCPVSFRRSKSKEILAYLTDRKGSWVSNRELAAMLWDDSTPNAALSKYITTLVRDLVVDLESAGADYIIERQWGKLRLLTHEVVCDYYSYLQGEAFAKSNFQNEYMSQYSWGEATLASIVRNTQ